MYYKIKEKDKRIIQRCIEEARELTRDLPAPISRVSYEIALKDLLKHHNVEIKEIPRDEK